MSPRRKSLSLRKSDKNPTGGLSESGRRRINAATGSKLQRPVTQKSGLSPRQKARRKSFCARMKGMKKKLTSKKTARDPDSRINKSLRAWNC